MTCRTELDEATSTIACYDYPEFADAPFVPSWDGWEEKATIHQSAAILKTQDLSDPKALLEQERLQAFAAGRARGLTEGREAEKASQAAQEKSTEESRLRQAATLVANFEKQSRQYFETLEPLLVKLSLAVAARILRREAQSDPLLLLGAVRVALGQVAASTEVRIIVPKNDAGLWKEAIDLLPNLTCKAEVTGREGIELGECLIETSLGKARLDLAAQLNEIERILLERRPAEETVGSSTGGMRADLSEGER